MTKIKYLKSKLFIIIPLFAFLLVSCDSDDSMEQIEKNDCKRYTASSFTKTISGTWGEPNESDEYIDAIVIPDDAGGGYVKVMLSQSNSKLRPSLTVDTGNIEGGAIISGSSAQTNDKLNRVAYFSVHPGMKYSLETHPFFNADTNDYPVDYTITWEFFSQVDCFEQNDTKGAAKKILFDETIEAYAIAGYIDYFVASFDDNTYDWYKVILDEPSVVEVEVLDMPKDMRITMRLFDADGSEGTDFDWLGAETDLNRGRLSKITTSSVLNPGTYYIELHSDFVASRKSNSDLEPIPEHFNKTYKIRAKKL